jgi:hypothetical protein
MDRNVEFDPGGWGLGQIDILLGYCQVLLILANFYNIIDKNII